MKEYKFDSTEENRMGQYLIEALKEEDLISESLFHTAMLRESMAVTKSVMLTENEGAHAVETRDTYTFQGVTVTRDAFRAVYVDYDKYPNAEAILYGLGFPAAYRSADESTLNKRVKKLVRWYNNNTKIDGGAGSNPANTLQSSLHQRKRYYSFKAREENSRKAKGYATTRSGNVITSTDGGKWGDENYRPTVDGAIDGGRNGRRTPLSRSVEQVNSSELIDGTFYNDRTKIPQRVWSNWVRFWDKRQSSVRPNRRSLLGAFFGMTWKKTFILGYSVNNNTAYEIWYNSYDSTFSIYDRNGVDVTRPIATVQESIKSLIHIIAQQGEGDIDAVAAGGTNNDTVRSMMRGLATGLDKDMDVIKRQDELTRHEAMRLKKEKEEKNRENQQEKEGGKYSVNHTAKVAGRALKRATSSASSAASSAAAASRVPAADEKKANALMKEYTQLETEQKKLQDRKVQLNQKLRGEQVGSDAYQDIKDKMFDVRQRITQVNIEMQSIKSRLPDGYTMSEMKRKEKNERDWARAGERDAAIDDTFSQFDDERDPMVDKAAERRIKALRKANNANTASPEYRAAGGNSQAALAQQIADTTQEMHMVANEREIARRNAELAKNAEFAGADAYTGHGTYHQITNGIYYRVYGTTSIPAFTDINWDEYALKLDAELKSMNADYKKTIRQNNAEALAKEFGTEESASEMKKNAAKGKYGLGDRFNVLKRANEAVDPFSSMGQGNDEPAPDSDMSEIPQIDDRQIDPQVKRAREMAEKSPYTQNLLKSDVAGALTMYTETKVPEATLTRRFISGIQGEVGFLRGRESRVESPTFGLWNRFKMSLRNQYYRSDFVIGFNLSNAIDIEVWYVTEPDPNNPKTTLSSFYVYDVNAQKMIRKYAPYYRTALMVVVAKLGVKL